MTDFSQYTNQQLAEAIAFYRRQRNGAVGLNESAHVRAKNFVRLAEAEQARRLNEEKPNHYIVSKRKNGEYGVSQDVGNNVWDHSYHHGTHKTVDAAKAWAVKHAGKYPHKIEVKEEIELDEVSASTLRNYIDKSRADKKAAMKDRTTAEKNIRTYGGMAMDKKERDDAARRVGNRNQGISVANKKLGTYPADKAKAKVMAREEVEQIDEISTELKKRYVEKGGQDVVDRFTSRGKYERPRDPSKYTKTGRPKKSAVNSPESVKYREKLDNRRDIVNKVSQEVHGKKRFGEEVVQEDWRDTYWKAAMKKEKQLNKIADADRKKREAAEAKAAAKKAAVKEEVEINEASDLRITKIYNKWPKKATYAVHTPDRKYFKEFDSMEAAKAHHDEKTNNK